MKSAKYISKRQVKFFGVGWKKKKISSSSEEDPEVIGNQDENSNASKVEIPATQTQMYYRKLEIETQNPLPEYPEELAEENLIVPLELIWVLPLIEQLSKLVVACQKGSMLQYNLSAKRFFTAAISMLSNTLPLHLEGFRQQAAKFFTKFPQSTTRPFVVSSLEDRLFLLLL